MCVLSSTLIRITNNKRLFSFISFFFFVSVSPVDDDGGGSEGGGGGRLLVGRRAGHRARRSIRKPTTTRQKEAAEVGMMTLMTEEIWNTSSSEREVLEERFDLESRTRTFSTIIQTTRATQTND